MKGASPNSGNPAELLTQLVGQASQLVSLSQKSLDALHVLSEATAKNRIGAGEVLGAVAAESIFQKRSQIIVARDGGRRQHDLLDESGHSWFERDKYLLNKQEKDAIKRATGMDAAGTSNLHGSAGFIESSTGGASSRSLGGLTGGNKGSSFGGFVFGAGRALGLVAKGFAILEAANNAISPGSSGSSTGIQGWSSAVSEASNKNADPVGVATRWLRNPSGWLGDFGKQISGVAKGVL